ncbi:Oleosin Ara h 15.0101 [Linum grandiflorum]
MSRRMVKLSTGITICTLFTLLFGLTLTATVMTLVMATPLLVLFSPVLVPAALATVFVTSGFLVSGGCGMAAAATLLWMYTYVAGKGKQPQYGRVDKAYKHMANHHVGFDEEEVNHVSSSWSL